MNQQTRQAPAANRRPAIGGRRRLINGVDAILPDSGKAQIVDVGELLVRPGDQLVVETPRGKVLARVRSLVRRQLADRDQVLRVVRRAADADLERHAEGEALAEQAMRFCVQRIRKRKIAMKVVKVEYTLDRGRVLIYFSSEERVDFRQLVRDLATELNVRIEMRQIGVRDGAGVIGGIGPCGKELCCSSFLESFSSISIRHAKSQNISLNPQKVTGMCGRLKCCLVYEHSTYKDLKRFMPRRGRPVLTPRGPGSIESMDVLARTVRVRSPGMQDGTWHLRDLVLLDRELSDEEARSYMSREQEILAKRRARRGGPVGGGDAARGLTSLLQDTYLWTDTAADLEAQLAEAAAAPREAAPAPKASRPARGPSRSRSASSRAPESAPQEGAEEGGQGRTTRRRRRRRKGGGGGDAPAAGSGEGRAPAQERKPAQAAQAAQTGSPPAGGEAASQPEKSGGRRRRNRRRKRSGGGGGSPPSSGGGSES